MANQSRGRWRVIWSENAPGGKALEPSMTWVDTERDARALLTRKSQERGQAHATNPATGRTITYVKGREEEQPQRAGSPRSVGYLFGCIMAMGLFIITLGLATATLFPGAAGDVSTTLLMTFGAVSLVGGTAYFGSLVRTSYAEGNRAVGTRLLIGLIALAVTTLNWIGHDHQLLLAWFFAGMTVVTYSIWAADDSRRRRGVFRFGANAGASMPNPTTVEEARVLALVERFIWVETADDYRTASAIANRGGIFRWFWCRTCHGVFVGPSTSEVTVRDERAAALAHEGNHKVTA